ncbi:MAG: hypothetical protein IBJ10_04285 [Phycisphaerales bacterium]|nr:hypothetical protein [Phycisphaerales bacterium]
MNRPHLQKFAPALTAAAILLSCGGCESTPEKAETAQAPARRKSLQVLPDLSGAEGRTPFEIALPPRGQRPRNPGAMAPQDLSYVARPDYRATPAAQSLAAARDLDVTLNFKGAPAPDVFREIFENVLDVDYVLAPGVTADMSFVLSGQISREELFRTLDAIAEGYGWALHVQNGLVHVVESKDAPKRAARVVNGWDDARERLSTATYVLPLSNVAATEIQTGLKDLLSARGLMLAPKQTNVLILVESPENAERMMKVIGELDQPFFASRILRLYTPQYVSAKELAEGLRQFATNAGARTTAEASQFNAVELTRSQQVLVTTTVRQFVPMLDDWVARIDQPLGDDQVRTYIYTAQQLPGATLASAIEAAFNAPLPLESPDRINVTPLGSGSSSSPPVTGPAPSPGETESGGRSLTPASSGGSGEDRLIIRARPEVYAEVRDLLRALDGPPKQVYLQVVVAEVVITGDVQFGIELFTSLEVGNQTLELFSDANFLTVDPVGSAVILGSNAFALVQAAANEGEVRVLSAPYLLALSGRQAVINVGREVPITTRTISGTTDAVDPNRVDNSIEYRPTGVILDVLPRVNNRGEVELRISQEVSDVEDPSPGAAIQSPSFPQRRLDTSVTVNSGDTVVLGGIRIERSIDNVNKIPFLGDLPLLGMFFRSKNAFREQTELVILVTPQVVIDPDHLGEYSSTILSGMVNLERLDSLLDQEAEINTNEMLIR